MFKCIAAALLSAPLLSHAATNIGGLATLDIQGGNFATSVVEANGIYTVESVFETDQSFTGQISITFNLLSGQELYFDYLSTAYLPWEQAASRSAYPQYTNTNQVQHYDGTTDVNRSGFSGYAYQGFTPQADTPVLINFNIGFDPGSYLAKRYGAECVSTSPCFVEKNDKLRVVFRTHIAASAVPEPQAYGLALAGAVVALAFVRKTTRA